MLRRSSATVVATFCRLEIGDTAPNAFGVHRLETCATANSEITACACPDRGSNLPGRQLCHPRPVSGRGAPSPTPYPDLYIPARIDPVAEQPLPSVTKASRLSTQF